MSGESREITPESIPYVMNPDGSVAGIRFHYQVRGGNNVVIDVPKPKGPDDGWKPGQYEKYMADLDNKSRPMIRAAIKKQYGMTSFRLVSATDCSMPYERVASQFMVMVAQEEAR